MNRTCIAILLLAVGNCGQAINADEQTNANNIGKRTTLNPRYHCKTLARHPGFIDSLAFSPDGRQVVVAGRGKERTVKVWDARTGDELLSLKHDKFVTAVAYSPDGKRIATASWDKSVIVWDVAKGKQIFRLNGHTGFVYGIAYSPDGKRIATTSRDKTVRVWDVDLRVATLVTDVDIPAVRNVVFSPDGKWIASPSDKTTVKLWNVATGAEAMASLGGHTNRVISVAFSPDGRHLAVGCGGGDFNYTQEGEVKIWDVATRSELRTLKHGGRVSSVAFSPNGTQIAAARSSDVLLWDTSTGKVTHTLDCGLLTILSVAFSPDGTQLVTGGKEKLVKLWDAQQWQGEGQ